MRVVVIPEPRRAELRETPAPALRPGHVLIETELSSISAGTELLVLDGRLPGIYQGIVRYPLVPGYENVGRVVEGGADVAGLTVGDWVVCEGAPSFRGLHSCWGAHAETLLVPADSVFRLPVGLAPEHGLFMVLTSIALHAAQRGRVALGDDVLVVGQGVVGLLAAQVARAIGARSVTVADRLPGRLAVAARMGLEETVQVEIGARANGAAAAAAAGEELAAAIGERSFDVVIEVTGSAAVAAAAARLCRERGRFVLAGMYPEPITFDYWQLFSREVDVLPSRQAGTKEEISEPYYRWTWRRTNEQSLDLLARGLVQVEPLISHRLPAERIAEGYEALRSRPDETLKVVLTWR